MVQHFRPYILDIPKPEIQIPVTSFKNLGLFFRNLVWISKFYLFDSTSLYKLYSSEMLSL